jgi:hypothetical protein
MNEVAGLIQAITGFIAALGALVVAWVAFRQWGQAIQQRRDETQQREQDLRWRQAEQGRKVLDDLFLSEQHGGLDALMMADLPEGVPEEFEDRRYNPAAKKPISVCHNQVIDALRKAVQNPNALDRTEAFIIECFDDLFYYLERIGLFLKSGFITLEDVGSPLRYYAEKMIRGKTWEVYKNYLETIRAYRALHFLQLVESSRPQEEEKMTRVLSPA